MLTRGIRRLMSMTPRFYFGGGHGHGHEFNRDKITLRNEASGYYLEPTKVARELIRLISLYDKVEHPQKITLKSKWHEIGLDEIDYVNLMFGVQQNFDIQIPDTDLEKFKNVQDVVEYVARSFYAK